MIASNVPPNPEPSPMPCPGWGERPLPNESDPPGGVDAASSLPPAPQRIVKTEERTTVFVAAASIVGGGLVMASAVAAAASLWGDTGITTRLVLLVAVLIAALGAAEYLTSRLQTVGRVLVHLAPSLVLPVAITATSQLGQSWRTWVMVGGAALIGTAAMLELKRRNT